MEKLGFALIILLSASCHWFQKGRTSQAEPVLEQSLLSEKVDSLPGFCPLDPAPCLLRIKQFGCGGPCPEWEARFYASGTGTLSAFHGMEHAGAFQTNIERDSIAVWLHEAAAISFFNLPDTLPQAGKFLPGLPTWEIEIRNDSLSHAVVHNHQGPASLQALEQQLENWVFSLNWERI